MWEVERRVNKDLSDSIPSEFSKTRVYEGRDFYFQLSPMIRLRDVTIHYPQEEKVYYVSGKVREGPELKQALNLGVDIHFEETFPEKKADIVATGPNPKKIFAVAKGVSFQTKMEDVVAIVLGNKVAYKGYSYLLVANGHGCMCTVIFDKFEKIDSYLRKTKKIFSEMVDLDVKKPRKIAGVGSFSVNSVFEKEGRLYVGEAAGLQDFLWGFGIKKALASGYLAAKSLIEKKDYQKIARDYFKDKFKASLVNRFLWEYFGFHDYSFILNVLENADDPLEFLFSFHNFNFFQRMLYPLASYHVKKEYRNLV
ncbi:hypothetical protein AKJ41_06365 [candidate division MSBL1 archaeon SCGC-AAA259O05]|uniref:Uncharacterized protein n=1 Tax=candidate division MSBL1 archaeon SCGC-AAA259O05 TaxID=1698271 RepID=A0A133UWX9_9EURY|nr:hypothetical protein AKJ41_06365 [candidate division MSBL1 archaeon SCGC-AAA259O05]